MEEIRRYFDLVICVLIVILLFICYGPHNAIGQSGPQAIASFGRVGIMTPTPEANLDVHGTVQISGTTKTGPVIASGAISGTTVTGTGDISTSQHYLDTSGAPAITACGTGAAALAGSNNFAGGVTVGTTSGGTCTATFANPYPNHAFCAITPRAVNFELQCTTDKTKFVCANVSDGIVFEYVCGGN